MQKWIILGYNYQTSVPDIPCAAVLRSRNKKLLLGFFQRPPATLLYRKWSSAAIMNGITKMIFRNFENTMNMSNNLFEWYIFKEQYERSIFSKHSCLFYNELDIGYDLEIPE